MMRRRVALFVIGLAATWAALAWFRVAPGRTALAKLRDRMFPGPDLEKARELRLAEWDRENAAAAAGTVVFIGSSTIERGPWSELFPAARCMNRGLGGETSDLLAARVERSLPSAVAAGVILYAGAADLRYGGADVATCLARVELVVDAIRSAHAGAYGAAPAALIEAMPEVGQSPARRGELARLNEGLRKLAAARGMSFVRTGGTSLADSEGGLRSELSTDGVHLNDAGYLVLADLLRVDGGAAASPLRR